MQKIYAPNPAFTGVTAGVAFTDGVAEFDPKANPAAKAYFRRRGFGFGRPAEPAALPDVFRGPSIVRLGTPAQDAFAEIPEPDPDAPTVEDMAAAIRRIHELEQLLEEERAVRAELEAAVKAAEGDGDGEAGDQGAGDTADPPPVAATPEPAAATVVTPQRPPVRAPASDWRDYAVAQGLDPVEAAETSKDKLIERYGG